MPLPSPRIMEELLSRPEWAMVSEASAEIFQERELFLPAAKPPDPTLLVPVDVQALYVPSGHSERFIELPLGLGEGEADVQPFAQGVSRPKGVHLHWALPDGLMRGDMQDDPDKPLNMRPLPDRWLVVRMTGPANSHIASLTSWVIESETGRVTPLENYPPDENAPGLDAIASEELDGVVGGSPMWTAAYDAAKNRFAFHDPLTDVTTTKAENGLASYAVMGWWSQPRFDPLRFAHWPMAVSRKLEELGWSASDAPMVGLSQGAFGQTQPSSFSRSRVDIDNARDTKKFVDFRSTLQLSTSQTALQSQFKEVAFDKVVMPHFAFRYETVMHGFVYGVPVRGSVRKDLAPDANDISLSMAPTLERLMAAQASKGLRVEEPQEREYLESLVTAMANGSFINLGSRDGMVELDETEHADGFEAFQGPDTYTDVIVERSRTALKAGRPLRTKNAARVSSNPPRAEVVWTGTGLGRMDFSRDALREASGIGSTKQLAGIGLDDSAKMRTIKRPGPRYFRATPPVVGLTNFGRTNRFSDGRFSEDGALVCRWNDELASNCGEYVRGSAHVPLFRNSALPDVADKVMRSALMGDPHMADWLIIAATAISPPGAKAAIERRLLGEFTMRYSAEGVYDGFAQIANNEEPSTNVGLGSLAARYAVTEELRRFSLMDGRDPSPVAVTNWAQPWCPVWLEWEVSIELGNELEGWKLGRFDFEFNERTRAGQVVVRGRSPITSGIARKYQSVIDDYLVAEAQRDLAEASEISDAHEDALADLAEFLKVADLGSITLDRVDDIWLGSTLGPDGQEEERAEAIAPELLAQGLPRLIASGRVQLKQARVIDTFGRFRDIPTRSLVLPQALEVKGDDGSKMLDMPPRIALPSRLMFRFVDPADQGPDPSEASLDQANPANTINPIACFILPDFMDESLEFFDVEGNPLGEVLQDGITGGVKWEGGVGAQGPAVASPFDSVTPASLAGAKIAQGIIDADLARRNLEEGAQLESPLSAFLRAIDTTMWSVDGSFGASGAAIAGLVGRPIAVVSAKLWLDIPSDLALTGAFGDKADEMRDRLVNEAVFETIKSQAFQVRLGELAKGHDGLYGYFVGDDFSQFHLVEKEVSEAARVSGQGLGFASLLGTVRTAIGANGLPDRVPITSPYIAASDPLEVHSGHAVRLTLLMHTSAKVHATTGFLPRKSLSLLREWVADGLERIAPSVRVGPVIIDPDRVRLPKVAAFGEDQLWTRRNTPISWRTDPILSATQAALLPEGRVSVEEGYIRIAPAKDEEAQ